MLSNSTGITGGSSGNSISNGSGTSKVSISIVSSVIIIGGICSSVIRITVVVMIIAAVVIVVK